MTDPPDLDAIRHANGVTHSEMSALCTHVDDLIAEVETLRATITARAAEVARVTAERDQARAELAQLRSPVFLPARRGSDD